MADLTDKERDALGDSDFAVPGKRLLPIHDANHARLAAAMVDRTQGLTEEERAEAKRRIAAKLKEFGGKEGERVELATITRGAGVETILALPITRIDEAKREVEAVATSEATDSFRTAFDYEASKKAFERWYGNVREMHGPKAVGRKVDIKFDDSAKAITVRSRISEGAADTWAKVLDGTLAGYSIGGANAVWEPVPVEKRAQGGPERICKSYDLVELSLVDNPSNPDARGLTIVRMAGTEPEAGEAFADIEQPAAEGEPATATPAATEERAGATISSATRGKLHEMRDNSLHTARAAMDTCGCDDCGAMGARLVPDTDDDGRAMLAGFTRSMEQRLAHVQAQIATLRTPDADLIRRLDAITGELGKVPAALAAVEGRLAKIEEQPVGGGPAVRAVAGLHAAEKELATGASAGEGADRVAILTELGAKTSDAAVQTFLAAEIMRATGTFTR